MTATDVEVMFEMAIANKEAVTTSEVTMGNQNTLTTFFRNVNECRDGVRAAT